MECGTKTSNTRIRWSLELMGGRESFIWTDDVSFDRMRSRMFSSVENERRVGLVTNWVIPRVDIQIKSIILFYFFLLCHLIWFRIILG